MFIQTEATPNPATLKFIPGKPVLADGTADYRSPDDATSSPLAQRLFEVDGVTGVFLGPDFISVTKREGEWQHLKPAVLGAIMEHYMSGAPAAAQGSANDGAGGELRPQGRGRRRPRSRNCSTPACARPSPTTAATSLSQASARASSTCTCVAPARAAPARRQRCATASRTCCATSAPRCRKCRRSDQAALTRQALTGRLSSRHGWANRGDFWIVRSVIRARLLQSGQGGTDQQSRTQTQRRSDTVPQRPSR